MAETALEPLFVIEDARIPEDLHDVRELFTAYATWLKVDLAFQGFNKELAALPGKYARSSGRILVARRHGSQEILGCVAMRKLGDESTCEMKRLYCLPSARGLGVGRALAQRVIAEAKAEGYARMVLDSLSHMQSALLLYKNLSFREIPAYYDNPIPGVIYLELDLTGAWQQ